jgi:hypothetical protein
MSFFTDAPATRAPEKPAEGAGEQGIRELGAALAGGESNYAFSRPSNESPQSQALENQGAMPKANIESNGSMNFAANDGGYSTSEHSSAVAFENTFGNNSSAAA